MYSSTSVLPSCWSSLFLKLMIEILVLRMSSRMRLRCLLVSVRFRSSHSVSAMANSNRMNLNRFSLVLSKLDLPPFLTQAVKTQNPFKGELSHGVVKKNVHQGVQAGCGAAAGARGFPWRGCAGAGSKPERAAPLAA